MENIGKGLTAVAGSTADVTSAVLMNIAVHDAVVLHRKVVYITGFYDLDKVYCMMAGIATGMKDPDVSLESFRWGEMSDEKYETLRDAVDELHGSGIMVIGNPPYYGKGETRTRKKKYGSACAYIEFLKEKYGIDEVIYDNNTSPVWAVTHDGGMQETYEKIRTADFLKSLRNAAEECRIPICVSAVMKKDRKFLKQKDVHGRCYRTQELPLTEPVLKELFHRKAYLKYADHIVMAHWPYFGCLSSMTGTKTNDVEMGWIRMYEKRSGEADSVYDSRFIYLHMDQNTMVISDEMSKEVLSKGGDGDE